VKKEEREHKKIFIKIEEEVNYTGRGQRTSAFEHNVRKKKSLFEGKERAVMDHKTEEPGNMAQLRIDTQNSRGEGRRPKAKLGFKRK